MAPPDRRSTHLITALLIYRPWKDERLSWPSWLTYSRRFNFTHISGHSSDAGQTQNRESSLAKDRRSTTVPRHLLTYLLTFLLACVVVRLAMTCIVYRRRQQVVWSRVAESHEERKRKEEYLYSAIYPTHGLKALKHGSHSFTCKLRHACLSFVSVHQMAPPLTKVADINCSLLLIY